MTYWPLALDDLTTDYLGIPNTLSYSEAGPLDFGLAVHTWSFDFWSLITYGFLGVIGNIWTLNDPSLSTNWTTNEASISTSWTTNEASISTTWVWNDSNG